MWIHAAAARPPGPPPMIATSHVSMKQDHINQTMQKPLKYKSEHCKKETQKDTDCLRWRDYMVLA